MEKTYREHNISCAMKQKDKWHRFGALAAALGLLLLSLCSCSVEEKVSETDTRMVGISKQEKAYIAEKYGMADEVILARKTRHTEKTSGGYQVTEVNEILDGSHDGAVFCKSIHPKTAEQGNVCVHLEQTESQYINLHAVCMQNSYVRLNSLLVMPLYNEKYIRDYVIVQDDYFMNIRLSEEEFTEDDFRYNEEITVYDTNTAEERYQITREVADNGMQLFCLNMDAQHLVYAEGVNYIADEVEFVSSQKEFCDKVNTFLDTELDGVITLQEFSWENRWDHTFRMNEAITENSMVSVDYAYAQPTIDEKGDEITNMVIAINDTTRNPADVIYAKPEKLEDPA